MAEQLPLTAVDAVTSDAAMALTIMEATHVATRATTDGDPAALGETNRDVSKNPDSDNEDNSPLREEIDLTGEVEEWSHDFKTREALPRNAAFTYQIEQTGPIETLVGVDDTEIWVDGIRANDGYLLEAKYVESPDRSPFVEDSQCPSFVRNIIHMAVEREFERYAAVIRDPAAPLRGLKVITNERRAVPYFEQLMAKYKIPGNVVIR